MRRDQLLEPPDDVAVLSQLEGGRHRGLLCHDTELAEPGGGGLGEVRRAEVAQHVAAPQGEGVAQQRSGTGRVADPECLLAASHQVLDHVGIEVGPVEQQRVSARAVDEGSVGSGGGEDPAHGGDVGAKRGRSSL